MSTNLSKLADELKPYFVPWVRRIAQGNGGGSGSGGTPDMLAHELASTSALGTFHTVSGLTAGQVLKATGATTAAFGTLSHTYLSDLLTGDPHTQYALRSIDLTAGNGLTGGGTLAANRTLTLGTPGDLTVSTTSAVTTTSHTHAVTASADVSAGTTALLKSASGLLTVATLTAGTKVRSPLLDTVAGDMTIAPAGDIILNPTGNDAVLQDSTTRALRSSNYLAGFPLAGFRVGTTATTGQYGVNAGVGEFDELRARIFVADETRVDRGQEYITKSYGILSRPFTVPLLGGETAFAYFENSPHIAGAIFTAGDYIMLRWLDMSSGIVLSSVWGTVASYNVTGLTGEQRWTFTLENRGLLSGEIIFPKSAMAVNFGQSGQGYILSDAVTSTAPFVQVGRWVGANPWNPANRSVFAHMGRLDGVGLTGEDGFWAGTGTTAADSYFRAGAAGVSIFNAPIEMYNSAVNTGKWYANGSFVLSKDSIATTADRDFHFDVTAGVLRIGRTGTNKPNLYWTGSALQLRQNTTPVITLDSDGTSYFAGAMSLGTSGGIYQGTGTFASPTTGLKIWNDTGIGRLAGYSAGVLQAGFNSTGQITAGGGAVVLDANGASILATSTTSVQTTYSFRNATGVYGGLYGTTGGGTQELALILDYTGNLTPSLALQSNGNAAYPGNIQMRAEGDGYTAIDLYPAAISAHGPINIDSYIDGFSSLELKVNGSSILRSLKTSASSYVRLGYGRTADGAALFDLIGDTTYTEYGLRFTRNSGANGGAILANRGTGALEFRNTEAADMVFKTSNLTRLTLLSGGLAQFASSVAVGGDYGATSGYLTLTNATQGVSSGSGTVKMNGITGRNSVGWVKIYLPDGTTGWQPYWTIITG